MLGGFQTSSKLICVNKCITCTDGYLTKKVLVRRKMNATTACMKQLTVLAPQMMMQIATRRKALNVLNARVDTLNKTEVV